jgi:hypothetical protein
VVEALRLSTEAKKRIVEEVPFADAGMYNDAIYKYKYRMVFLSVLTDANLGVYQRKGTGERLAFLEYLHPLTEPASWPGLLDGSYYTAGFHFTQEILQHFAEGYEFLGRNTASQTVENLTFIRQHLSENCTLVILLGGELPYEKNTIPAYNDRHLVHRELNSAIRKWAVSNKNVELLDVNRYLDGQNSFYDHFNHYTKPIYYSLAKEMVQLINEATGIGLRNTSRLKMVQIRLKEILAPWFRQIRKALRG